MSSNDFDPYDHIVERLHRCNHTELYQMCRRKGLECSPRISKQELIELFLNGSSGPPVNHVIDSWRHGLTGFVFEHWKILEPQLTCPLRSKNPKSCWGCLDTQVIACVNGTAQYEQAIQLHRKP